MFKKALVYPKLNNKSMKYRFVNKGSLTISKMCWVCGGRAYDLPGVRYNMVKGKYDFSWKKAFNRTHGRSKYGVKRNHYYWINNDFLDRFDSL